MFDTHCHLNDEVFKDNYQKVIKNAREVGVNYFVIPGVNYQSSKIGIDIANNFMKVYAAIGIHPTEDLEKLDQDAILLKLEELADDKKVVAIGEIGLDYYHYKSSQALQKKFFDIQLKLSVKLDLGVIIHNRASTSDVLEIIENNWNPHFERRLVFHCVTPDKVIFDYVLKRNLLVGIDGDITYDGKKQEFLKSIPLENIVVETDSPYLIPEPKKSKHLFPNEPSNLEFTVKYIASIKKKEIDYIKNITTKNAKELFAI